MRMDIDERYDVLRPLGFGGSGDVYLVRDRGSGEALALKSMRIDEMSPSEAAHFRRRFEHEAQTLAGLAHRHIVSLRAYSTEGTTPYVLLEHIEGIPFLRAALSTREVLALAAQLFDALAYLHKRGIVHRDISSANVLVRDKRELKLIDFGIALSPDIHRITRAGSTLGKAGSIDPHVLRNRGEGWSTKSDIYSAGVLLYRALLRRRPHVGSNMLHANMENAVIPPRDIDAGIVMSLEAFLLRLLESRPRRRPTAEQALDLISKITY